MALAWLCGVYPRVRGEYRFFCGQVHFPQGLSPRARGIQSFLRARQPDSRSIPACAGNTTRCWSLVWGEQVYPRVRGEYLRIMPVIDPTKGLSPRARGIPDISAFQTLLQRSIPACAGNTRMSMPRTVTLQVYPRVRGEYVQSRPQSFSGSGLSPRARGILVYGRRPVIPCRSIPACAGNTPT